jgi:hypothetical protein
MSDDMDKKITSRKVTSLSNDPLNRGKISEERSTKVSNNHDNNATGVIVFVVLAFAVGAGAIAYFVYNRPAPTPILVPSAVDTVKENKSTVIERNNTTIREVSPATPQTTPKVEVNFPIIISPAPAVVTPQASPQPQATTAPVAPPKPTPTPTPTLTPSPQIATPTPSNTE